MEDNLLKINNKKVFLIGGEGLIGIKIKQKLVDLNCQVYSLDINPNIKEKNKQTSNINYIKFDVSERNYQIKFENLIHKYGCPDILINCSYPRSEDWIKNNFSEVNYKSFETNIRNHLNTYTWIARLVAENMKKNEIPGIILLFSSMYGIVAQDSTVYKGTDMKENYTYSVIKGGIISSVKQLASYYGKYNIRVNSISPGAINGHVAGKSSKQSKIFKKNFSDRVPLRRLAEPDEIANAAIFLISNLSSYVTASNLIVDGGWTSI